MAPDDEDDDTGWPWLWDLNPGDEPSAQTCEDEL